MAMNDENPRAKKRRIYGARATLPLADRKTDPDADGDRIETQAERIIRKFGGVGYLFKALQAVGEYRSRTTIQRWKFPKGFHRGSGGIIPTQSLHAVSKAARYEGIILTAEDFDPRATWITEAPPGPYNGPDDAALKEALKRQEAREKARLENLMKANHAKKQKQLIDQFGYEERKNKLLSQYKEGQVHDPLEPSGELAPENADEDIFE